jgi:hypothetical protein
MRENVSLSIAVGEYIDPNRSLHACPGSDYCPLPHP